LTQGSAIGIELGLMFRDGKKIKDGSLEMEREIRDERLEMEREIARLHVQVL
jgi:hypothetical protein